MLVKSFTLHVFHHTGITQGPHDHLVQKSRQLGATWVHKLVSKQKSTSWVFYWMIVTKYINRYVICDILFTLHVIHHIGITQRNHDHLVQKLRQPGATWVHKLVSKQKSTNLRFFLHDCYQIHYQIDCMSQFVHFTCNSSYWHHAAASWPFSSKVEAAGCYLGTTIS